MVGCGRPMPRYVVEERMWVEKRNPETFVKQECEILLDGVFCGKPWNDDTTFYCIRCCRREGLLW